MELGIGAGEREEKNSAYIQHWRHWMLLSEWLQIQLTGTLLTLQSHPKEGAYISNFTLVRIEVIMLYFLELFALSSPYAIYGFEFKGILGNGREKH